MQITTPRHTKTIIVAAVAVVTLMAGATWAASYMTKESLQNGVKPAASIPRHTATIASHQQVASAQSKQCNDGNILGAVAGGVGGGVLGHQFGGGGGKTAATIGGTLGGAYLGSQYIPLNNATCRN